ncbi:MAG: Eco57I restriction-modification methylase domain-containing protein [Candidatus Hodarchaeales archaeon]|jgi:hypothetical protein
MLELYSNLKPFYEKFLKRGQSYGLVPHEIHENALNIFVKVLGIIFLMGINNFSHENSDSVHTIRKIRIIVSDILFHDGTQKESSPFKFAQSLLFKEIFTQSHQENQLKDSLDSKEWEVLFELLLSHEWILEEKFDLSITEKKITPEFLSYFYENILNEFENFFSLTPKVSKRKQRGVFITPWRIIREITDKCLDRYEHSNPKIFQDQRKRIKLLDPSVGTGSFLVYAAESIYRRIKRFSPSISYSSQSIVENYIYGVDLSLSSLTVTKLRLLLWILNINPNSLNSLPANLFRNICIGNSLFGLCRERVQYPLDYSLILERISNNIGYSVSEKENWLNSSFQIQKAFNSPIDSKIRLKEIKNAQLELSSLINTLYRNWLQKQLKNYPRSISIKKNDYEKINPFHWGVVFPEVMLRGGFDLIVGNPPYGRSILSKLEKSVLKLVFKSCSGKNTKKYSLNAASAFIERSITLLKSNGIFGMIVPFSILRVEEFETLRKFILENSMIWEIDDESAAFSDVTLEMCSIFLTKKFETDYKVTINSRPNIIVESEVPIDVFRKYNRFMIYFDGLWDKIVTQSLVQIDKVSGDYGIDHRIVKKDLSSKYTPKYCITYLHSGRCVSKYGLNPKYFQWSKPHPTNDRFSTYFRESRLVNTAIGNRFRVAYKPEKFIPGTNVSVLEIYDSSYHYFPMLILLNSDLLNYLLKRYILNFSNLTIYLHKYYTNLIPIKYPSEFEEEFSILASYLVFLNQGHLYNKFNIDKRTEYLQNLANYLVYDLYFPEILGFSSNLALSVQKYLIPIEIDTFLDLIFFHENASDLELLTRIIDSNLKIIQRVTNTLRKDEEIRLYKKTIFNNEIVKQIRKEL